MVWIRSRKSWQLSENEVTPEAVYRSRRNFLKQMSWAGLSAAACLLAPSLPGGHRLWAQQNPPAPPGAPSAQEVSPASLVTRYNNFYEFGTVKERIWKDAENSTPTTGRSKSRGVCENHG